VISYAASTGKKDFAALIPRTSYGDITEKAFRDAVKDGGGTIKDVERFSPSSSTLDAQTDAVTKASPDAIFIPQGGSTLRNIAPLLVYKGAVASKVKLLGTGLWDDLTITREASLKDGWFAAPAPDADEAMMAKYHRTFGGAAPPLATLAYDAISLVALLAPGQPYHRFTIAALTDPNGFAGVDGIFRFNTDGSLDRGLAVLRVGAGGFHVIDPAPTTFEGHGS
jgi:ABC-type branched-subunit amino acid transport system substrate-binding protein